ncbi:MAG: arsenosugar biosynthesis radical SAM protein ArsS [Gammaproteobacteria bacterium]|nr:arsenosugar biosynthesis radical SAM protein ArsS [Gammaproteobacteria bacterium]
MHDTLPLLNKYHFPAIQKKQIKTLQINITLKCNQACFHCHVNASPKRTEMMDGETLGHIYKYLDRGHIEILDITGGAPELHPEFRSIVTRAIKSGIHVIDRCNLTVLEEPGQEKTMDFLAGQQVEIVASLPCYLEKNVDRQRGEGVFKTSIRVLQKLNEYGYGTSLPLNLVYNPQGPVLPPSQEQLENQYREYLSEHFGIRFNELYVICNMPINRFGSTLVSQGLFQDYMNLLRDSHKDENLENVMCRDLISVDWQGYLYDCDFNQMLGLGMRRNDKKPLHISDLLQSDINGRPILVRDHCYGCTAGQGSSCGGALAN